MTATILKTDPAFEVDVAAGGFLRVKCTISTSEGPLSAGSISLLESVLFESLPKLGSTEALALAEALERVATIARKHAKTTLGGAEET